MRDKIKIGYMGLNDAAPLIMAAELGLYEKHQLEVTLFKQNSWSTLRDRLHLGDLHAAQMLAPMPLASSLGLGCQATNVFTPIVLSLNGNAITLSSKLIEEIKQANGIQEIEFPMQAGLLKSLIDTMKKEGKGRLKFAHVFPFSCHYYQLQDWLKQGGISQTDIDFHILPPHDMHFNLSNQNIDGYCVGGPWNALAVRQGTGVTVATSCDIWGDSAEKVLGICKDEHQKRPDVYVRLVSALLESCQWLDKLANRFEAGVILASSKYLNTRLDVVCPSLMGICLTQVGKDPRELPAYNIFGNSQNKLNIPNVADAHTFATYIYAQNLIESQLEEAYLSQIYRSDLIPNYSL